MGRKRGGARVLGPYPHDGRWKLVFVSAAGKRNTKWFASEGEARGIAQAAGVEIKKRHKVTLGEVLDGYEKHMIAKGNQPDTIESQIWNMEWFFGGLHVAIGRFTVSQAQETYLAFAEGKAASTHRNMLSQARTFGRWLVKRGTWAANPFMEVQGFGKRKRGKTQLRVDEARKWSVRALERAESGCLPSLAGLLVLTMGLRASEALNRKRRDFDDGEKLLVIEDAKTQAGNRTEEIPEFLRPLVSRALAGLSPDDEVFPYHRGQLWYYVQLICMEAGVQRVSTHSLRGFASSSGIRRGLLAHEVARELGHTHEGITRKHYIAPGTIEKVQQKAALVLLRGAG